MGFIDGLGDAARSVLNTGLEVFRQKQVSKIYSEQIEAQAKEQQAKAKVLEARHKKYLYVGLAILGVAVGLAMAKDAGII